MTNFKVGVIGVGGQGRGWCKHMVDWKEFNGDTLELVAVSDIEELTLKRTADQYKCKAYKDYKEMLDKEKLDIMITATPHYMHAPISIYAAEKGINVLTEKIMCINLKQADAMKAAVEKYKIKLAVGFQHRFNSIYVAIKRAIEAGEFGDLFQLNMIFHWWRKEDYYLNSSPVPENEDTDWAGWRGHWKTEGAGALANQIVHFMDQFLWFAGSPLKSVSALSRVSKHTLVETDDNTNAVVDFQNGAMGLIQAGVAYEHDREETFAIYGTKGAMVRRNNLKGALGIPTFYEDHRPLGNRKKKSLIGYMPKTNLNPSKAMFQNFINAIKNDDAKSISVGVDEGRKTVELLRAILLSQIQGKRIDLPFVDPAENFPELLHTFKDPKLL